MALKLDTDEIRRMANSDPQFLRAARLWNFDLLLRVGETAYLMEIVDGEIKRFHETGDIFRRYSAVLGGTESDWQNLLATVPVPFYQDFFGAFFQHEFQMAGDLDSLFAHYWALLRLLDLMRASQNGGGAT